MLLLHYLLVTYLHDSEQANLVVMKVCVVFHLVGTALMGFLQAASDDVHW
jgi:hypothetical protein